jgi:hypothetical protein
VRRDRAPVRRQALPHAISTVSPIRLHDLAPLDAAMDAALLHGRAFFGPNMTAGAVIAALNGAEKAISERFGNLGWITERF